MILPCYRSSVLEQPTSSPRVVGRIAHRWIRLGRQLATGLTLGLLALLAGGCGGVSGAPPVDSPSAAVSNLGPTVDPPSAPETGEVARFWFARPGSNKVSVGPYAVASDELVVRGACRSHTGRLIWKVIDNSSEADSPDDVKIVDQGKFVCDGSRQEDAATVGTLRDLAILGVTDSDKEDEEGESAWLTLANE
jgi:hypothetical protein